MTGYLVPSAKMEEFVAKANLLEEALSLRDKYKELSDQFQIERDEFKDQRDHNSKLLAEALAINDEITKQRDDSLSEIVILRQVYTNVLEEKNALEVELDNSWAPWEVGLLTGGIGVVSILSGVGLTYLLL
jgi:hypothetical protein